MDWIGLRIGFIKHGFLEGGFVKRGLVRKEAIKRQTRQKQFYLFYYKSCQILSGFLLIDFYFY